MPLFRKLPGGQTHLATSMVGLKAGDRLLQIGCGDGRLLIALAAKAGLTGRVCAIEATEDGLARGRQAAARGGVLVEFERAPFTALPYAANDFDVVVAHDILAVMRAEDRAPCLADAKRVLRGGGRLLVVDHTRRRGLAGLFGARMPADAEYVKTGGAEGALRSAGFVAVRTLAEREGLRFIEAGKPRS